MGKTEGASDYGGTGGSLEVLLVEDEWRDARLITEYLNDQAWPGDGPAPAIRHVERLAEALEARDADVDIVLLDLGLPDCNRFDTLEPMLETAGDEPIVVLTGLDDDSVGVEAVERGAQDYLVKDDLTPRLLHKTIRYAIERERQQEDVKRANMLFQHAQDGLFVIDVEADGETFRIDRVNRAFEAFTDASAVEIEGQTIRELSDGPDSDSILEKYRACLSGRTSLTYEGALAAFDSGSWWETRIAPVVVNDEVTQIVGSIRNITERKERDRRLQAHELVTQSMNEVVFLVDEDKRIQFANEAALDFANVSRQAINGRPIGPIIETMAAPDEDPQRFFDAIDALVYDVEPDVGEWVREPERSETLSLEFDLSLDAVGTVCAEQRFVPVKLFDGGRGVAVISRDITARKEKEEKIQTHLQQAQDIGNVGSWYLELDTGDLELSDESYRILGLEPGVPMTYEQFIEITHPEDRENVDEALDTALKDGSNTIDHRIVADGETRWVQQTAKVVFSVDGTPESAIGVIRDVTERVQRTREIRAQKYRYESLFNSVSGAVVVTDLDGYITTYNPGFTDLFGYRDDDIVGDHFRTILHDGADVSRLLDRSAQRRDSALIDYQKSGGQVFPGESRSSLLRTHDDDIGGHVVHIVDVSEVQANREQLQVISRIFRHNVKNDMNVIRGRAEHIEANSSTAVTSDVETIVEKSRNFLELAKNQHRITDLLTNNSDTVDVNVTQTVRKIVSDVQMEYPDAALTTNLASDCEAATTVKIAEAIRELIENAIVHSEQGHPCVNVHLRHTDTMIALTIRDDGPGIPDQEWDVFTADGEINRLNHGTGLGLWFVNEAIRVSDGTISFDTNELGGTTVTVRLPAT